MAEFIKGSVIIALLEMLCQPPSYPSFELRRLGQKGRTSPRSCMAVSHVMKKFKKSNNTFPQRGIDILAWFAQLFVGRRYISQRRAAHPHMHAVTYTNCYHLTFPHWLVLSFTAKSCSATRIDNSHVLFPSRMYLQTPRSTMNRSMSAPALPAPF